MASVSTSLCAFMCRCALSPILDEPAFGVWRECNHLLKINLFHRADLRTSRPREMGGAWAVTMGGIEVILVGRRSFIQNELDCIRLDLDEKR